MSVDPEMFLHPTPIIESEHPRVRRFAVEAAGRGSAQQRAVSLYYAVRDGIRYDPYRIVLTPDGLKASTTLGAGHGWCVTKAILLAACCRSHGIPARLGFADVRNHLSTQRMRAAMQTDVFFWHGYAELLLDDRWIKTTPAFNRELCDKLDLRQLDFDGRSDSLYQPCDLEGKRHMEYLRDRGWFEDVPIDDMLETFRREYPVAYETLAQTDFDLDVEREVSAAPRPGGRLTSTS